jgi:hypothetical protein
MVLASRRETLQVDDGLGGAIASPETARSLQRALGDVLGLKLAEAICLSGADSLSSPAWPAQPEIAKIRV